MDLLETLARAAPHERDAVVEAHLGIGDPTSSVAPGSELVGYHASGIASIVRSLIEVPVSQEDVLVDLGSGLGKVVVLAHLFTGVPTRGIELQSDLVDKARRVATRMNADVEFVHSDVRAVDDAALNDGTVFFLYLPFTGAALASVLGRLHAIASRRTIVICALGVDLDRAATWLVRREVDSFWLAIYDSVVPGSTPRPTRSRSPRLTELADVIAFERPLDQ